MSTLPDHLQKRLVWLEKKAGAVDTRIDKVVGICVQEVARLDKHIAFLEERLDLAHARLNKLAKSSTGWANTLMDNAFAVDEEMRLLYERVEIVEKKAYPAMAEDAAKIGKIIGKRPTRRYNPLDKKNQ